MYLGTGRGWCVREADEISDAGYATRQRTFTGRGRCILREQALGEETNLESL